MEVRGRKPWTWLWLCRRTCEKRTWLPYLIFFFPRPDNGYCFAFQFKLLSESPRAQRRAWPPSPLCPLRSFFSLPQAVYFSPLPLISVMRYHTLFLAFLATCSTSSALKIPVTKARQPRDVQRRSFNSVLAATSGSDNDTSSSDLRCVYP